MISVNAGAYDVLAHCVPGFIGAREYPVRLAKKRSAALRGIRLPFPKAYIANGEILLLYLLDLPELPTWAIDQLSKLRQDKRLHTIVIVLGTESVEPESIASPIIRQCTSQEVGLAIRVGNELGLVVAPRHKVIQRAQKEEVTGHIPKWLIARLTESKTLSKNFSKSIAYLSKAYSKFSAKPLSDYDDECQLLDNFARRIAKGDRRLFFPVDLLSTLRDFERSRANPTKRDHFFHTFNNLLLGYILLAEAFPKRTTKESPDKIIFDKNVMPDQHPWESLWALTCLFHDRGYIAEDFHAGMEYNLGLTGKGGKNSSAIPEAVVTSIVNAWDTEFGTSHRDLIELASALGRGWRPHEFKKADIAKLETAFRKIYFFNGKCGHSLMSGLTLINRCECDKAAHNANYEKETALSACEIAALSMVFHDQHARTSFTEAGFAPIPFENLPYASTLAFVDALQEDRRDISKMRFPSRGALVDLIVDPNQQRITAKIDMRQIKIESWPWKIAEFAEVLRWVSQGTNWKFRIDYLSSVGG